MRRQRRMSRLRRPVVALLVILAPIAAPTSRLHAAIEDETGSGAEGLKMVNAQMVRELASRGARLGTSTGASDTTFVGYTPGHFGDNYWSIWSGLGKDGFKRPINGVPDKGTWDWEVALHGDSLQGWWPLLNMYASTGGQIRTDRNRPWWALDFGNMANYRINEANGRNFGVVGGWHRDYGSMTAAIPCGTCASGFLPKPRWNPPSGSFAAWMGLRAHGDNAFSDPETGNPFNEDLLMYVGFGAVSGSGNDYFFPGYGSTLDQMLDRGIYIPRGPSRASAT